MTFHTILLRALRHAITSLSVTIPCACALADSAASSAAAAPASSEASAAVSPAPSGADWHALNKLAGQQAKAKDYAGLHDTLVRLAPLMPGSPTIAYNLAATAARLGRAAEALGWLTQLADAGLYYDLAKDEDFASLAGSGAFNSLRERLAVNRRAIGRSSRLLTFEADTLPESLAWDARTKRLFVSSVRHCEIRVFEVPGHPQAATTRGHRFASLPSSVFALGLDAERHRLWATIAAVPQADACGEGAPSAERTTLIALDLRTGRVLQRVEAGVPGVLGDLMVAEDGTVFVTESAHGAVLRLRPGAKAFDRLDHPGEFVSPQTPALSADGRTLFVPDYARGMAAIELGACPCPARWLAGGAGVYMAGIDGLVRDGHELVAVQNGMSPARVIRFAGDLSRQQVLESGTPGLGEPTHGIVVGRALWFISDVGWDRFDDAGRRKAGVPASRPELRRLELGAGRP